MAVLERGGNAFDAAVATGFVLQVVEPHLNGPGGEVPAVFWSAERGSRSRSADRALRRPVRRSSASTSSGTTSSWDGVLAACVPGSFGGWLLLLRDFGTWRLGDVLEFAIGYAEHGYPLHERIRATIQLNEALLASWPGSRDLYLPLPRWCVVPEPGACGDVSAHRRGRAAARGRDRGRSRRTTRASSRTRSTASAQPKEASSPARDWLRGARRSSRSQPRVPRATVCKTRP